MKRSYLIAIAVTAVVCVILVVHHSMGSADDPVEEGPVSNPTTGHDTAAVDPPPPASPSAEAVTGPAPHVDHLATGPPASPSPDASTAAAPPMPPPGTAEAPVAGGRSATTVASGQTASGVHGDRLATGSTAVPVDGAAPGTVSAASLPHASALLRPAPAATASRDYVIQPGDSFSSIAVMAYGAQQRWIDIVAANPSVNPRRLIPGHVIKLPPTPPPTIPRTRRARVAALRPTPATESSRYYTVRPGDTLSKIAREKYGSGAKWTRIYSANRAVIGPDPDRLALGVTLRLQ